MLDLILEMLALLILNSHFYQWNWRKALSKSSLENDKIMSVNNISVDTRYSLLPISHHCEL